MIFHSSFYAHGGHGHTYEKEKRIGSAREAMTEEIDVYKRQVQRNMRTASWIRSISAEEHLLR